MGSSSSSTIAAFWTLRSFLGSFLLIVTLFSNPSLGFASWLKCYVDLDPSEVIMYQKVVAASDAAHVVVIEVQAFGHDENVWLSSSSTTAATSATGTNNDNDNDNNPHMNTLTLPTPFPGTPLTLRVRLRIPPSLVGGDSQSQHPSPPDIQYVVEATTSVSDAAAEVVEFIDRGVMCDGKRAFSRRHDEPVILQIDLNAHPELEYVTLVAGWATELEAVTLTPILTLIPARTTTTIINDDEGGIATTSTTTIPPPPTAPEEASMGGTDEL